MPIRCSYLLRYMLLLPVAVLACAPSGCRETGTPGKQELRVGALLSFTGGAAAYGTDVDKGARLAVDELNALNEPLRVKYTAADDKSDKSEAATQARALVQTQGVHVILGPAISPSALSVGKYVEEHQIPMVTPSANQDEVTHSSEYDRTYVSRVCFDNAFQGRVLARFIRDELGLRRVATIYDKTLSYSIGLSASFKSELEQNGGTVVHEEFYSVKDTDYSTLIDKVAQFDVEALFIPGWDENVGPMLKQSGRKWDRFMLVGPETWPSNRLLELAGGNVGRSYALSHYVPDDPNPIVARFTKAYQERYREIPSPFAALGYDTMKLIWHAAKRARSLAGPDLKDAINTTRDLELVTGTVTLDKHRNPQKDAVIVRVEPTGFKFHRRVK